MFLFPCKSWQSLHLDYGHMEGGHWLLIVVDYCSKWIDVHITSPTAAIVMNDRLRQAFATHDLSPVVVTNNVIAFSSTAFSYIFLLQIIA